MRLAVRPFLEAPEDSVRFLVPWHEVLADRAEPLGERILDWDHRTVLKLQADLEVDVTAVRAATHSGPRAEFAVVVSAASSTTRLRGPVWTGTAPSRRRAMHVETNLAGTELGGRLDLVTQLVVTSPDPADALAPHQEGAILWRHRHPVLLEGDAAQFPTEAADLSVPPYNLPKATWMLELLTDDLDVVAGAALRLIINHTHPVMQRVSQGDTSPESVLVMSALRWDVTRRLIDTALDHPEFIERDEAFEEDSLGWLLTNVINMHFPGESARSLRKIRDSDPGRYQAALQDATRVFG